MEGPRHYRTFLVLSLPVVALIAVATRSSALLAMALTFCVLLAGSWALARRRLQGLGARREVYPSAFEDDAVSVDVVLENRSGRAAQLVEITDSFGPGIADRQAMLVPGPLGSARRRRLRYQTFCSRHWGVYALGPLSVATSDPAGLFRAVRTVGQVEPFTVFPRVYDVAGLMRRGARPTLTPQETSTGRSGQGSVYLGVRDYRAGDDLRRIHWPATARRGSVVVKEYEIDLTPYFTLFLDLDRAHRAGTGLKSTLEYIVRTAASLLWSATRRGDFVQLFGEGAKPLHLEPGRGEVHLTHCLNELIHVRQEGKTPILDVVGRHHAEVPEGSTAAILSGTISIDRERLEAALEAFRARAVRPLLVLVDEGSFVPIDRWPLPRAEAFERCQDLTAFMRSQGIPGTILRREQELSHELARPDLLWELP